MKEDCPMCQIWRSRHAPFCSACGKELQKKPDHYQVFFHILPILASLAVVTILIVNTCYDILNYQKIMDACSNLNFSVVISFGVTDLVLFKFHGAGTSICFTILILCNILFLGYGLYKLTRGVHREYSESGEIGNRQYGLSSSSALLCISLFGSVVFFLVAAVFGQSPNTTWMDSYSTEQMAFMLTRAGFREELMCRVFWIGLPMMIIALIYRKDKRCWHYLFGGFGLSKTALFWIVLSSVLFGLAHLDGWGWTKVPSAIFGGLIFGLVFTKYGLYAAVLIHTANDTMSALSWIGLGPMSEVIMLFSMLALGGLVLLGLFLESHSVKDGLQNTPLFPDKIENSVSEILKRQ